MRSAPPTSTRAPRSVERARARRELVRLSLPLLVALLSACERPTPVRTPAGARTHIAVDGSSTIGPIARALREDFERRRRDVRISISESGSGNGIKSLINGTCDVAMLSRPISSAEFRAAAAAGVRPLPQTIALDAIAIVVHPGNPLDDLRADDVRAVYRGDVTDWSALGGPVAPIVLLARETTSGTGRAVGRLLLGDRPAAAHAEHVATAGAMLQRVRTTPGAIGYTSIGFVGGTVKVLSIDGVAAVPKAVTSGRYPLARQLFLVTDGYPPIGSPLEQYLTLYLTPRGQATIELLGYIPVTEYETGGQ